MEKLATNKNFEIPDGSIVKVKKMGHITEIMYMTRCPNTTCFIKKLSDDEYIDLRTGEVMQSKKILDRSENNKSISMSLMRLRDYVNYNVRDNTKARWITLTYKNNMRDSKQLYADFQQFIKKIRRHFGKCEYIVVAEPQGRGAWHMHVILLFANKAPYIANKELREVYWLDRGFVKINSLTKKCDNLGAYFSAYLTDVEYKGQRLDKKQKIKEIIDSKGNTKKYIKGARLKFYPPKFNLYRCSRGIKKPIEYNDTYRQQNFYGELTYKNSIRMYDDESNAQFTICYEYYNNKRDNDYIEPKLKVVNFESLPFVKQLSIEDEIVKNILGSS